MFLRFNLKNNSTISLTEEETKIFIKKLNYLKLLKLLNSKTKTYEGIIEVKKMKIDAKDIKSIEAIL